MSHLSSLAIQGIQVAESILAHLQIIPHLHFELEGGYIPQKNDPPLNYQAINNRLKQLHIPGELKPEYWNHQWEYVSLFSGQTPLEEAHYLAEVFQLLPKLIKQYGASEVLIKPILWFGDQGRLQEGCKNIFTQSKAAVHIPNAIQLNLSLESQDNNLMAEGDLALKIQRNLLETSYGCCLLFLPDEESYQRLALKKNFNLSKELTSPHALSGGRQGSIALYRELGKHGQAIGPVTLFLDASQRVISSENRWQQFARIEHRLGASSLQYNPYINILFALMNIIDVLEHPTQQSVSEDFIEKDLPKTLFNSDTGMGSWQLFKKDNWFNQQLNEMVLLAKSQSSCFNEVNNRLGDDLKAAVLQHYQQEIVF